jgi:hypothetical protein
MTQQIQARLITDMPWGGVANQGQHVLFDLRFADGSGERYLSLHGYKIEEAS